MSNFVSWIESHCNVFKIFSGVTFVSASDNPPVQYLITLTKQDEVMKIKHHLLKMIPEKLEHPIVIGEVLDNHIAKILV